MADAKWVVETPQPADMAALQAAGYSRVLATLLLNRGIRTPEEARAFFGGGAAPGDPFDLPDMHRAVAAIREAMAAGERIAVYGDYDVDGVTSTALLATCLRELGADAVTYLPERESEGYGLNAAALEKLRDEGAALVVTVDTGISAFDEALAAARLGLKLVITDHHEPRETLPQALAVVNPKRADSTYPFRELAGVGVAFRLACALAGPERAATVAQRLGALAALGTVADVVPLTGENRALVRDGLTRMDSTPGIRALLEASGGKGPVTARWLAFTAGPRINAAGRMGSARDALALLLERDETRAGELARHLEEQNRRRQTVEGEIFTQAVETVGPHTEDPVLLVAGENWHDGVIGIVASRLVQAYGRPAAVVSFTGDEGRASCRSLPGFDIHKALMHCAPLLERFGGHSMAAGFTVRRDNLTALRQALNDFARSLPEIPVPELRLECELQPQEISLATVADCERLEPCGAGNPSPLFYIPDARIRRVTPLKGGRHLRLDVQAGTAKFQALLFGADRSPWDPAPGDAADLAVELERNCWNGTERLSVIVRDAAPPRAFREQARLYRSARSETAEDAGDPADPCGAALLPGREDFAAVYRYLRPRQGRELRLPRVCGAIAETQPGFGCFRLLTVLDVFCEMGLMDIRREGGTFSCRMREGRKVNLEDSRLLRRLRSRTAG